MSLIDIPQLEEMVSKTQETELVPVIKILKMLSSYLSVGMVKLVKCEHWQENSNIIFTLSVQYPAIEVQPEPAETEQ